MHALAAPSYPCPEPDRPSTRASNDPPDHAVHGRSRSTAYAPSPRRLSVFSGRSRSNTTTSTASSFRSPASSMTSVDSLAVPDDRTPPAPTARPERPESVTKSFFARGSRILRRQGSKFNISATLDEEDESERDKSAVEPYEFFSRSHKSRQNSRSDQLKTLISDPFDFHHLTHTNPTQFQSLDTTRESDLVTEFSAIRASQRPGPELKGIRAEDLQFRDFCPEELGPAPGPVTPSEEPVSFAISTPETSPSASFSVSPKQPDHRPRRESRVLENFSRPVPPRYSRSGATTPPVASPKPPASELSEPAPRAIDEVLGLPSQQTYPDNVHSTPEDAENVASLSQLNLAGMFSQEGRALSPVHDSGANTRTSSVSLSTHPLDLEDVPEEEEATQWHDSPEPIAGHPTSRSSCRLDEPLAEASPTSRAAPKSQLSIFVSADLSKKFSEVLGSPTLPQFPPEEQRRANEGGGIRRQSRISKRSAPDETTYESWDADIDYCYDHAAEANSNFDWSRNSLDEPRRPENGIPTITSDEGDTEEADIIRPLHSIRLSPSTLPTPDLDPSPARSLANPHAAATPSTSGCEGEHGGVYFHPVSSSMLPPTLGKQMTQDALYEDYLAADAESDRHFSFCSQGAVQPIEHSLSPRSSFSPISKCNSQESLMISRAASVVRKHRSSVSTTSVPDLVHSLSGSRETMPADQAPPSEQATSAAAAFGRPGSATHRQTRSLARELEAPVMWRDSNSSLEHAASASASPTHDRAKSTSDVETPLSVQAPKSDGPHPAGARKSTARKARASYSLFPFPGAAR
ncbi:hypothetical protein PHISP_06870 [Aspergillus sp. HF37]|nr:hypothetical protein PHISP_06870 [Aspergillus sp. HF37]